MQSRVDSSQTSESAGTRLLAAACALRPTIDAVADDIERERRLPASLVDALYDAGLFHLLLPRTFGGSELDLLSFARIVEELAKSDASVAWCIGQANGLTANFAYFPSAVGHDVFSGGGRAILANGPGEGNVPGRALGENEGYRISGRWAFASGITHAAWLLAICQLPSGDAEPQVRLMLLPIEQATILDTWHVSGLRGTGSHSFVVDDVFVPAERSIDATTGSPRETGPLYLFTAAGIFGPSFAAVALGIADTALRSSIDFAGGKTQRGVSRALRDSPTVQASLARASARLAAARALLHHTLSEVWAVAEQRGSVSTAERVRVRLASTHAIHEAAAVVDVAYEMAGSNAIFANGPFERRFRDVHAVTQQLQGRAAHFETVGRFLLGLDPSSSFL
jgi:alkylation response protein AidB-like acyl-CoA dehydrogenase